MEKIEFSQDELKYIMASINNLLKTGSLQAGDILLLAPVIKKVSDKIKVEPIEEAPEAIEKPEKLLS